MKIRVNFSHTERVYPVFAVTKTMVIVRGPAQVFRFDRKHGYVKGGRHRLTYPYISGTELQRIESVLSDAGLSTYKRKEV